MQFEIGVIQALSLARARPGIMSEAPPLFQSYRPRPITEQSMQWRVWAPLADRVEIVFFENDQEATRSTMLRDDAGVHTHEGEGSHGLRYGYSLDGGPPLPDPCSLHQPTGVHDPSEVYFPERFDWRSSAPSIEQKDRILYELHIGTFTTKGTFDAAIARLDDLVELGVNTLEVLPVSQFPGERNWGYDGVHPYATQNTYGGPEAFQRFVDAAHDKGLQVILDVVFNHLGPEGNYLSQFGPYFTNRHSTPWGQAFRFDDPAAPQVRDWILDCVSMWIHDFRIDGLRLDAVHAIFDSSERHLLSEIKLVADQAAKARGGDAFVIAESLVNDPSMVTPLADGGLGLDAEWNEDFHHAVSAWMTEEAHGKYVDYGDLDAIENVLRSNLHLTGQHSHFYGEPWGREADSVAPNRYVISLQNHDHIGNRACGERIATLVDSQKLRLAICLQFLSPFLPMLFMGEEYGETNPFLFFCSFSDPQLIRNVRRGRKRDYALQGEVPDPQAESSFEQSKLSWAWEAPERKAIRQLVRDLIALRKEEPGLREISSRSLTRIESGQAVILSLETGDLCRWFNMSEHPACLPAEKTLIWRSEEAGPTLAPFGAIVFRDKQEKRP